jgi:hypothetical protein
MAEPQKKSIAEATKSFLIVHTPLCLLSYPSLSIGETSESDPYRFCSVGRFASPKDLSVSSKSSPFGGNPGLHCRLAYSKGTTHCTEICQFSEKLFRVWFRACSILTSFLSMRYKKHKNSADFRIQSFFVFRLKNYAFYGLFNVRT